MVHVTKSLANQDTCENRVIGTLSLLTIVEDNNIYLTEIRMNDEELMRMAIAEAKLAENMVICQSEQLLFLMTKSCKEHNNVVTNNPTAHAEILAIEMLQSMVHLV